MLPAFLVVTPEGGGEQGDVIPALECDSSARADKTQLQNGYPGSLEPAGMGLAHREPCTPQNEQHFSRTHFQRIQLPMRATNLCSQMQIGTHPFCSPSLDPNSCSFPVSPPKPGSAIIHKACNPIQPFLQQFHSAPGWVFFSGYFLFSSRDPM